MTGNITLVVAFLVIFLYSTRTAVISCQLSMLEANAHCTVKSARINNTKDYIQASEEIMSSMTCEQLPQEIIQTNAGKFGKPVKSVIVRVGEGNNTYEQRAIIIMD